MDRKIEVIASDLTDVIIAEKGGVDRIELVTALSEGGLTPSLALIEEAVQAVGIPVNVMIRPHSRSFHYSAEDLILMQKNIAAVKRLGAKGVVFGTLRVGGEIDEYSLQTLLDKTEGMDVTFHRAFDHTIDLEKSLELLMRYPQVNRILTSGGESDVNHAIDRINRLVELSAGTHVIILAGGGLNLTTLCSFLKRTCVREIHMGTGVRSQGKATHNIELRKLKEAVQMTKEAFI
jgi:copper homeostasis protein